MTYIRRKGLSFPVLYFLINVDENTYVHALKYIYTFHTHLFAMDDAINSNVGAELPNKFWAAWNRIVSELEASL